MADNAAQSIKELQERLVSADKTLGEMIQRLGKYESWMSTIFSGIAKDAKVSIDEITDYLTKKMRRENLKQAESLMKDILGIEDAKKEVEKVPTMFERVINEINAKAANKKGFWANELFHSEFAVEQAKKNFARVYREFAEAKNAPIAMAQASFAPELERLSSIDQSILSKTDLKKLQERIAQVKSDLASISKLQVGGDAYKDPSLLSALKKYQDALEQLSKVKEHIAVLDGKEGNVYAANARRVEGVTQKYNENEQALAKLQQRWEELNVKKQAGLISQKDFDAQTQKILDEYDRLIAKRKEFEIGDLGQMSSQRQNEREREEERLAQLRKSNTQARLDDEMRAERMIKQARAERAKKEAEADPNMKKAVSQQVTSYKQLSALLKQYNSLKQVKGRTQEEEAALERTRQKIKEIIAEMRKLDSEQKGSLGKARDITEYDRILAKDREITNEKKKQNDLTKQQKANLNSLLPTLQRLASAFGVAFSVRGLAQFGKKLIETRGEFERQQVALRSILQNKQLADEIWDKTMQAALQSPFTAMQLTTYTKQLAAYRIETDKLFETTKRLADVSAGLGVDMQRLILAYGQVKAANYLRASEIRQFTEAGVNVLGELRDYFNDVKGMSVDTAQVMEMVTKRLVTFEDVEAIFKRMTDQGGIFYEMQYVQSQTVRGQIAKLHDAYDQMLNSIGQANEGALKNMVSLLNSIVKNWKEFKTVIDLIAWPLLISFVYKFSRGLMTTAAASVATSASMNKLTVAGARTQLMFKRLFATIAAHPFIALGAAVAAVGVALLNHAKHVRDINKRYEDLMLRTYETQKNLDGLSETIRSNLDTMKKATKGSEEYNEASRENENIVKKLKDQYPELLQDIDIQKDGYEKLIEKIKEYNEELENNIRLEYAARAGFWQDDLTTNIADLQEAQRKREMQFLQNRELAERRYLELKAQGKEAEEDIWNKRIRLAKDWQEQVDIINQQNESARGSQNPYGEGISIGDWSLQMRGFVAPIGDVERNKANLSSNIKQEALVFNDIIRDQLKTINEDLGDDIQQFITDNETQINELFKDKEGAGWKLLNKQITKFFTAKGATDKETRETIQNFLNEYLLIPIQLDWDNIGGTSGSTTPPQTSGNKTKENASKLISLIKEMRSEYDKLSKSAYGYAKSEEKVRDAYAQSVEKILGKAGVTKDYDFTTNEGMIAALDKVLAYANKLGPEAAAEVQKYIDQLETEIEINAQVKIRKDFGKEIEKMFSNYDLTIDLEKLNVPTDELVGIFNLDVTTLDELRKFVDDFYNKQIELGNNPTELVEQVEGYYKKIDEMEKKELRERLKEYSKYLADGQNEALKIHLEELKKMAELDELYQKGYFTDTQYKDISNKIKKETDEKLAKNDWQQFKESDFYITMFEDMSRVSSESIDIMIKRLKSLRKSIGDLDPKQAKEVVKALEKLEKVKLERSPLKSFFADLKTAREWRKNADNLANNLREYEGGVEYWKNKQDGQSEVVAGLRAEYDQLVKNGKLQDAEKVKENLDIQEESLSLINEQLENQENLLNQTNQEYNEGYAAQQRVLEGLAKGAQYFSDLASTAGTISTEIMDMFDGVSDASKKLAKDIAEIATNTAALAGDIAKAIASEGSDVGSMIDGLVRTWNIVKGAFSVAEAEINRTIEKNTEKLEDLETELERVKKARDKAWDVQAYRAAQKEIEYSIEQQIEAYDALISAEEDRKSSDKDQIRTWKKEREELFDQLEEEREQLLQDFGAIGESAYRSEAQGFVDAWKDAFLETGDGLSGLEDHFDEFLQEWFTKQATMRVAGRMLEPLFKQIDAAVDEYGQGGTSVTMQELADIRQKFGTIAPQLSDALEQIAGLWGVGESGSLSGLAAGIQGMTEEQANILEAYWNSVRGYTASIDMNVARIADALGAGGVNTNPQLQQLSRIAASTQAVTFILQSVTKSGHSMGGQGIKVFLN